MIRFAALAFCVPALFGQLNSDVLEKAPPDVEDALRARIGEFYQLHVDAKFRQAEQLVAEDSKDFFYSANKPKYLSFTIQRIQYSENFSKALATVLCKMFVPFLGFADKPMDVPTPSRWKVENGKWVWYIDPETLLQTPFGKRKPVDPKAAPLSGAPSLPTKLPTEGEVVALLNQVKADKSEVKLNPEAASSDQVLVHNQMPGYVTVTVKAPAMEGLQAKVDHPQLKSGEKATVTFSYKPGKKKPEAVTATITVEPLGRVIPVAVTFAR